MHPACVHHLRSWFLIVLLCCSAVTGYKEFQRSIPNGDNVPHPCLLNHIWRGVGHINAAGGGTRNPFGLDFFNNRDWADLCPMDSDGDGRTNGEELGDPTCIWRRGQTPSRIIGLSHPGICETADGQMCSQNTYWVDCTEEKFVCDAINSPDVRNITFRFPHTRVPSDETKQICFAFDIPADDDYHVIAYTPFINNSYVTHHMRLLGCDDTASLATLMTTPLECKILPPGCEQNIGGWGVGYSGYCMNAAAGIPVGRSTTRRVIVQIHWNNPLRKSDYWDSSGMTMYYTANKRKYDLNIMYVGSAYLNIPPGQPSTTMTSRCSSECTRALFSDTIYVTDSFNHMHYLGRAGRTMLYRNGEFLRMIGDEPTYSYDSPNRYMYDPPIEIRPGDELITTCEFDSTSRQKTTRNGPATSDEMCVPGIRFYTNATTQSQTVCTQYKDIDSCLFIPIVNTSIIRDCNWANFLDKEHPETKRLRGTVFETCRFHACTAECKQATAKVKNHACMKGILGEYMIGMLYFNPTNGPFLEAMSTCENDVSSARALVGISAVLAFACLGHLLSPFFY